MASTPGGADPLKVEAIVYFVVSPANGPGHRIYCDEDIQTLGGIHTIEQALENESYWYVRLGKIRGDAGRHGVTFQQSDFGKLPEPSESEWKTGRCNHRNEILFFLYIEARLWFAPSEGPPTTCFLPRQFDWTISTSEVIASPSVNHVCSATVWRPGPSKLLL